jgi:glycerol-3-phosphate acyltransferase PlsY
MMVLYIVGIAVAYLLGSIPSSVWIGKIFFKKDVREFGSGNAGATNTVRVLGWKAGIPVMIIDVFKSWLAVIIAGIIAGEGTPTDWAIKYQIIAGLAAVVGHVFPIFASFRGGKGVATFLGVGIALYPITVWIVVAIFIALLFISGFVSLASIIASISFPFIDYYVLNQNHTGLIILSVLVGIIVPLTHIKNIKRLIKGEEKRFIRKKDK